MSDNDLSEMAKEASAIPWSQKSGKAVWRGSTTGAFYTTKNSKSLDHAAQHWRDVARSKAALLSRARPDLLDAGFTNLHAQAEDAAVEEMAAENLTAGRLQYRELFGHKILLNLDGNSVADRLPALMVGGSAVVKQESRDIEFWYQDMKPFEHYLPVRNDLSDLQDVLEVGLKNDTLLQLLAQNSRNLVLDRLSPHSMMCYWIRLLRMYSAFTHKPVRQPVGSLLMTPCHEWGL
jgi:hypothetical protein